MPTTHARPTPADRPTSHYVALLRGVNVGGRNRIAMADLRAAFSDEGYGEVRSYIQSGNVLFSAPPGPAALEGDIERMLEGRLGLPITVLVRSNVELGRVVGQAPPGFGSEPDTYHSDVIFLKAPLRADEAVGLIDPRPGVDRTWPGTGVVYVARVSARRSRSRLSRIVGTPEYQLMTIRNWATTTNLAALLDQRAAG